MIDEDDRSRARRVWKSLIFRLVYGPNPGPKPTEEDFETFYAKSWPGMKMLFDS